MTLPVLRAYSPLLIDEAPMIHSSVQMELMTTSAMSPGWALKRILPHWQQDGNRKTAAITTLVTAVKSVIRMPLPEMVPTMSKVA
jgi:hypothetical protein